MTRRRPNLKLLESDMDIVTLPSTVPAVLESSAQRLLWQRAIDNARDERGLVDAQIEGVQRVYDVTIEEAELLFSAKVDAAQRAVDRERTDASKVLEAGVTALRARQADLDGVIAGYEAALGARI